MDKKICNTGRQLELDIAKGLAVIFMVLIHTVEYYWNWENEVFNKIANFLGSPPAAPVFMLMLGCGIVYSKRSTPEFIFKRGMKMLGLSYIFNALVYVLPCAIYSLIHQDSEFWSDSWSQIYDADILQFAALAFLFFAVTEKLKFGPWLIAVISIAVSGAGMLLNHFISSVENPILQAVTGLFWGTHEGSYFPFTSWIIYPAFGYLFAYYLKRTENKKKLYLTYSIPAFAVYMIMTFVMLNFYDWDSLMDGDVYYHQGLGINVMFVAFVFFWLGICYAVSCFIPKLPSAVLQTFSSNVTPIYVCQYIFILYIQILIVGENTFNVPITLLFFAVYTVLSYYMAKAYKKFRKRNKAKA